MRPRGDRLVIVPAVRCAGPRCPVGKAAALHRAQNAPLVRGGKRGQGPDVLRRLVRSCRGPGKVTSEQLSERDGGVTVLELRTPSRRCKDLLRPVSRSAPPPLDAHRDGNEQHSDRQGLELPPAAHNHRLIARDEAPLERADQLAGCAWTASEVYHSQERQLERSKSSGWAIPASRVLFV